MWLKEDIIRTNNDKDINSGLKKLNNFINSDYDIYYTFKNTQNIEFLYKMIFESFKELGKFSDWKHASFLDTEIEEYIKVEDVLKNFIEDLISHISKSDVIRYYTCYDYHGQNKIQFTNLLNNVSDEDKKNLPFNRVIITNLPSFIKSISHQKFKNYLYIKWNNDGNLLSFHDIDNDLEDNENYIIENLITLKAYRIVNYLIKPYSKIQIIR